MTGGRTIDRRALLKAGAGLLPVCAALPAARASDASLYRQWAREAAEYVQRTFWDERVGLYRPAAPPDPKALPYDFMWANGVQLSALVAAARDDPRRYRPVLNAFFRGLDRYWDAAAPVPGYDAYFASPTSDDKYYDDNAWMVLTFVEAYEVAGDRAFLDRADAALRFVLSGWDEKLGGGIYWHQSRKSKNTCSNAPTAVAALRLARHRDGRENVEWARRIVAWTQPKLQAPDGLYWDNCDLDGKIERTRWTYNTALMLRANLELYRHTRERAFLAEAERLGAASEREFVRPETGAFRDNALFSHLLVEAFLDLYRETRAPYLLERARRNAGFLRTHVRDRRDGGYWNEWRIMLDRVDRREERKILIANASASRLLWLVADAGPD